MRTVFVVIGNSDDKLSQARWAEFVKEVDAAVPQNGPRIQRHGVWFSRPDDQWQNACWCFGVDVTVSATWWVSMKTHLAELAVKFGQDSIAWADTSMMEFIGASYLQRFVPEKSTAAANGDRPDSPPASGDGA
jgi:hypothetical protein